MIVHEWNKQVIEALRPIAKPNIALQMKAYLRDQFECYGIQAGPRRLAVQPLFTTLQRPPVSEIPAVVHELWRQPERECQMVAIDLLIKVKDQLPPDTLSDIEQWITTKSWWDTVDMLATHIVGRLYQRHPIETKPVIQAWRKNENLWLRRTALLFQLKYKHRTDVELLFAIIRENRHDRDFFIQKAIGWVLREYSKTDPEAVVNFVDAESLDGLAKREALKWLKNRGAM